MLGSIVLDAGGLLDRHLGTLSSMQGVELEGEVLVLDRDPGIADIHLNASECSSKDSLFRGEVSSGVTCPQGIVVRQLHGKSTTVVRGRAHCASSRMAQLTCPSRKFEPVPILDIFSSREHPWLGSLSCSSDLIVMKFSMIPDETTLANVESLSEQPCQGLGLS